MKKQEIGLKNKILPLKLVEFTNMFQKDNEYNPTGEQK